ncbi:MAG: GWxTD domain-containing protein [Candidatus Aminicenantes bacterium]|nr:GWxTD domain-containing protein [Candidatus Aminicenantes bacterium]
MFKKALSAVVIMAFLVSAVYTADKKSVKDLSEKYKLWLEEEVVYIISSTERDVFLQLETDRERDMFIEAFWKHRDPTQGTPQNEYKEEHFRRIQYANYHHGRETPKPGWMTDRGRTYIVLGEPNDIERFTQEAGVYNTEVWFYQGLTQYGLPAGFNVVFFQKSGSGEFKLYSPTMDGPQALMSNYFGDAANYLEAYRSLREISPRLADISMSLIPGESTAMGRPSLSSDILIQSIYQVPQKQFEDKYAQKFLYYKDIVEVDYSANYIDCGSIVELIKDPSETYFIHYLIEITRFSIEQYQNKFVTNLKINGTLSDPEGKTIHQFERSVPIEMDQEKVEKITYLPFAFYDMFPLISGNYKLSVLLKNEASKEFTSIERDIIVPQEITAPFMSSLILGYNAKADGTPNLKPFKIGAERIFCEPSRLFHHKDDLHLAFQLQGIDRDLEQRAELKYEIFKDEQPVLTTTRKLTDYANRLNYQEQFSLQEFSPGDYRIFVRLMDGGSEVLSEREFFQITSAPGIPRPWIHSTSLYPASHPAYTLARGQQYFNKGNFEQARIELENVHKLLPDSQDISLPLANIYFSLKNYEKVIELLTPFIESEDAKYEVLLFMGESHKGLGEYDKAISFFNRAVARHGINIHLLNALGECYLNVGAAEDALATWLKSLEIQPEQPEIQDKVKALKEKN